MVKTEEFETIFTEKKTDEVEYFPWKKTNKTKRKSKKKYKKQKKFVRKKGKNASSKFIGVSWDNRRGRWLCRVKKRDKSYEYVGYFETEKEAAANHDIRAREMYARSLSTIQLNFETPPDLEIAAHPGIAVMNASDSEDEDGAKMVKIDARKFISKRNYLKRKVYKVSRRRKKEKLASKMGIHRCRSRSYGQAPGATSWADLQRGSWNVSFSRSPSPTRPRLVEGSPIELDEESSSTIQVDSGSDSDFEVEYDIIPSKIPRTSKKRKAKEAASQRLKSLRNSPEEPLKKKKPLPEMKPRLTRPKSEKKNVPIYPEQGDSVSGAVDSDFFDNETSSWRNFVESPKTHQTEEDLEWIRQQRIRNEVEVLLAYDVNEQESRLGCLLDEIRSLTEQKRDLQNERNDLKREVQELKEKRETLHKQISEIKTTCDCTKQPSDIQSIWIRGRRKTLKERTNMSSKRRSRRNEVENRQTLLRPVDLYSELKTRTVCDDGSCWIYAPLACIGLLQHTGRSKQPTERDLYLSTKIRKHLQNIPEYEKEAEKVQVGLPEHEKEWGGEVELRYFARELGINLVVFDLSFMGYKDRQFEVHRLSGSEFMNADQIDDLMSSDVATFLIARSNRVESHFVALTYRPTDGPKFNEPSWLQKILSSFETRIRS